MTGTIKKVMNDSGSSYCKMPDGTLICWGQSSIANGVWTGYGSFPVAFVNTSYSVQITWVINDAQVHNVARIEKQTTQFGAVRIRSSGAVSFEWLAIGRWK